MSQFPTIPVAAFYSIGSDGDGTLATSELPRLLHDREAYLRNTRGLVSGSYAIGSLPTGVIAATARNDIPIATFLMPPVGNDDAGIDVWIRVDFNATGLTVYSGQFFALDGITPRGDKHTICTPTGDGWKQSASVVYSPDPETPFIYKVTATNPTAIAQTVQSIIIFAETGAGGGSSPAAWQKMSHAALSADDRPFDVAALKWLVDYSHFVAERFPRVLAAHSFALQTSTRSTNGANPAVGERSEHFYKWEVGPLRYGLVVFVRVSHDAFSLAGDNGFIEVFIDDETTVTPGAEDGSTKLTINGDNWYAVYVPPVDTTVNTTHDLRVSVYAGATAGNYGTATVKEIIVRELDFAEADLLVSSTKRLEEPAPKPRHSVSPWDGAGAAIVSGYVRTAYQDRWADRGTLWRNVMHHAIHRRCGFGDRVGQSTNATSAAFASAACLYRTRHWPTDNAHRVDVWARACVDVDTGDSLVRGKIQVFVAHQALLTGSTTTVLNVTTAARYAVGDTVQVAYIIAGVFSSNEQRVVTATSATTVTVSPALSGAPLVGVRLFRGEAPVYPPVIAEKWIRAGSVAVEPGETDFSTTVDAGGGGGATTINMTDASQIFPGMTVEILGERRVVISSEIAGTDSITLDSALGAGTPAGSTPVRVSNVPVDIEIRGGFARVSDDVSASGGTDSLQFFGAVLRETMAWRAPAAGYFWQSDTGLSAASVTITVPATKAFPVRRLRVGCTNGTSTTITLTSPFGTARTLRTSGTGAVTFSDVDGGIIGDTTPTQALSNIYGETSEGVWTLAASAGTITAFNLEIW